MNVAMPAFKRAFGEPVDVSMPLTALIEIAVKAALINAIRALAMKMFGAWEK